MDVIPADQGRLDDEVLALSMNRKRKVLRCVLNLIRPYIGITIYTI